jgi:hypothetical protein
MKEADVNDANTFITEICYFCPQRLTFARKCYNIEQNDEKCDPGFVALPLAGAGAAENVQRFNRRQQKNYCKF